MALWPIKTKKCGYAGFTLLELLISITLGLLLLSILLTTVIGSKRTLKQQNNVSRMQENARYALYKMGYDIQMGGYIGCNAFSSIANVVNSTSWPFNTDMIAGFEGGVETFYSEYAGLTYTPTATSGLPVPDSLIIKRADIDQIFFIAAHNAFASPPNFLISGPHDIKVGEILVAIDSDCRQSSIFQATKTNGFSVEHAATSPVTPGNCSENIYGKLDCNAFISTKGGPGAVYKSNSTLHRYSINAYYIGVSASGGTALMKATLGVLSGGACKSHGNVLAGGGGNACILNEEITKGVENMQIFYGINSNGAINQYLTAEKVGDWGLVTAVRVYLLIRSESEILIKPQHITYAGNTYTPNDRYLRFVYSQTFHIRNRE
jgi:type IV pilus assembly protein PilW